MLQSSVIHAPIKRWLKPNKPIPWLVAQPEYPQVSMFLCHILFGGHTPACLMMFDSKGENYSSGAEWSAEAVDLRMGLSQAWEMIRNWEVTNQNQGMSWYSYDHMWCQKHPETLQQLANLCHLLCDQEGFSKRKALWLVSSKKHTDILCASLPPLIFVQTFKPLLLIQHPICLHKNPMMKDSQFAGDLHGVMDPLLACWQAGLIVASLSPGSWDDASPLDTSWVNHGWVDREVMIHVLPEMEEDVI